MTEEHSGSVWVGSHRATTIIALVIALTNQNEADGDDVSQDVASDWLVVLPVTFAKESDERV